MFEKKNIDFIKINCFLTRQRHRFDFDARDGVAIIVFCVSGYSHARGEERQMPYKNEANGES